MARPRDTVQALHPDPAKQGPRVDREAYEAYRAALLEVIPADADGVPFGELARRIAPLVPEAVRERTSPGWWATTVKLDLEARGLIERIEGRGKQRVRRTGRRET